MYAGSLICIVMNSGVGKTSLVARLTNPDRPINHDISATMGIEFDTQMLDTPHGKVKAQVSLTVMMLWRYL